MVFPDRGFTEAGAPVASADVERGGRECKKMLSPLGIRPTAVYRYVNWTMINVDRSTDSRLSRFEQQHRAWVWQGFDFDRNYNVPIEVLVPKTHCKAENKSWNTQLLPKVHSNTVKGAHNYEALREKSQLSSRIRENLRFLHKTLVSSWHRRNLALHFFW